MAEAKTYRCIYPRRGISGPDGTAKFDDQGYYTTDNPDLQDMLEGHEWFNRIMFLEGTAGAVQPKISYDDHEALARARRIAAKFNKKPEAVAGTVSTEGRERHEELDDLPGVPLPEKKPFVPQPPPEPEREYPSRGDMNLMSTEALRGVIKEFGLDVDPKLSYAVLKAAVKSAVEKRQLGME